MKELRLKDYENIMSEQPNLSKVMVELNGFDTKSIFKKWRFKKSYVECYNKVMELREIDPTTLRPSDSDIIKLPNSVDSIEYVAMLELVNELSIFGNISESNSIAELICKVCFSTNNKGVAYDSESPEYRSFKYKVLNSNYIETMGIYNWIVLGYESSQKAWAERFESVSIDDPDYALAGGARMSQFNIVSTLENMCKAFGLTRAEAELESYALVQTLSYKNASAAYTQDQMSNLKEIRMKASQSGG